MLFKSAKLLAILFYFCSADPKSRNPDPQGSDAESKSITGNQTLKIRIIGNGIRGLRAGIRILRTRTPVPKHRNSESAYWIIGTEIRGLITGIRFLRTRNSDHQNRNPESAHSKPESKFAKPDSDPQNRKLDHRNRNPGPQGQNPDP
jgi:hypothetical protein